MQGFYIVAKNKKTEFDNKYALIKTLNSNKYDKILILYC